MSTVVNFFDRLENQGGLLDEKRKARNIKKEDVRAGFFICLFIFIKVI